MYFYKAREQLITKMTKELKIHVDVPIFEVEEVTFEEDEDNNSKGVRIQY